MPLEVASGVQNTRLFSLSKVQIAKLVARYRCPIKHRAVINVDSIEGYDAYKLLQCPGAATAYGGWAHHMDMSDQDVLRIRQIVLKLIGTFDHCSAVTLPRSHRGDGGNEAKPFYFAMSPSSYLSMLTVEKEYH
jgi:hypothetical protein